MKKKLFSTKAYAMLLPVILLGSCAKNTTPDAIADQGEKTNLAVVNINSSFAGTDNLVFQSGFEPGSSNIPRMTTTSNPEIDDIIGNTTGLASSDWQYHLETKTPAKWNLFRVNYEGGTYTDRQATIEANPAKVGNLSNTVLKYRLTNAVIWDTYTYKGRIAAEEYSQNLAPGATAADQAVPSNVKEYYQKVKFYLPTDFNLLQSSTFPSSGDWLLLWEFRDMVTTSTGKDSRITIDVSRLNNNASTPFSFSVTCQEMNDLSHNLWSVMNTSYHIVAGKWLEAEIYIKEGGPGVGRTYFAVRDVNSTNTGQWYTLCDQYNITNIHHLNTNPVGYNGFNPMKLYCSASVLTPFKNVGKSFVMYWDDLEIHENRLPSPGAITP